MAEFDDRKQGEFAKAYAHLMDEARARLDSIATIRNALGPFVPTYVVDESGYTQLRMVCEIIAIGCLVAHGDIPATRVGKLLSAKYPTMIIPELESLHPDFYPVPFITENGAQTELKSGYLNKADLLALYGECGDALHRGALKKILKGQTTKKPQIEKILHWRDMAVNLIREHSIRLANPNKVMQFAVGQKGTSYGVLNEISPEEYEEVKALGPSERMTRLRHLRRLRPPDERSS